MPDHTPKTAWKRFNNFSSSAAKLCNEFTRSLSSASSIEQLCRVLSRHRVGGSGFEHDQALLSRLKRESLSFYERRFTRDAHRRSFALENYGFQLLPQDCFVEILRFVGEIEDLCRLCATSKQFNKMISNPALHCFPRLDEVTFEMTKCTQMFTRPITLDHDECERYLHIRRVADSEELVAKIVKKLRISRVKIVFGTKSPWPASALWSNFEEIKFQAGWGEAKSRKRFVEFQQENAPFNTTHLILADTEVSLLCLDAFPKLQCIELNHRGRINVSSPVWENKRICNLIRKVEIDLDTAVEYDKLQVDRFTNLKTLKTCFTFKDGAKQIHQRKQIPPTLERLLLWDFTTNLDLTEPSAFDFSLVRKAKSLKEVGTIVVDLGVVSQHKPNPGREALIITLANKIRGVPEFISRLREILGCFDTVRLGVRLPYFWPDEHISAYMNECRELIGCFEENKRISGVSRVFMESKEEFLDAIIELFQSVKIFEDGCEFEKGDCDVWFYDCDIS